MSTYTTDIAANGASMATLVDVAVAVGTGFPQGVGRALPAMYAPRTH